MTHSMRTLALFSCLVAGPASAQINLSDQLDAIRMAGSEKMMVHMLSLSGLPAEARAAREKLLMNMGLRGPAGSVGGSALQFSPLLTHDSNINGGFTSDGFTVSGIPFRINDSYKAVGGVVVGISGTGRARISLGSDTALEIRGVGSVGYAPEHDMFKASLGGSACVNHMMSYSTFGHVCMDASYRNYDLGEESRIGISAGASHVFQSSLGVHEIAGGIRYNRHINADYDQLIGSASITSAIPGPYAITAGFQIGEAVPGHMVMREKVHAGIAFKAFDRPTAISLGLQRNAGGVFLGKEIEDIVTSIGVKHQFSKRLSVSTSVAVTNSSDSFFDGTQYGVNFAWRW